MSGDVDCIITVPNIGWKIKTEFKTTIPESTTSLNFYLPLTMLNRLGVMQPGWFARCEADILIYAIPQRNTIYILNFKKFRKEVWDLYDYGVIEKYYNKNNETAFIVGPEHIINKDYCIEIDYNQFKNRQEFNPDYIYCLYNKDYYYYNEQVQIAQEVAQQQYDLEYNQFD